MKVQINGEERDASGAAHLLELLQKLELPLAVLLVEHNGIALRREEWPHIALHEGDRIELVRIVAGG